MGFLEIRLMGKPINPVSIRLMTILVVKHVPEDSDGGIMTLYLLSNMGVSKNRDTAKWMVKIMENPIKIHDLEVPLFLVQHPYGQINVAIKNALYNQTK